MYIDKIMAHIDTSMMSDSQVEELMANTSIYGRKEIGKGLLIAVDCEDVALLIVPVADVVEIGTNAEGAEYVKYKDNGDLGIVECEICGGYIIIK